MDIPTFYRLKPGVYVYTPASAGFPGVPNDRIILLIFINQRCIDGEYFKTLTCCASFGRA